MLALRNYLDANNLQLKPGFLKRVNGRKKAEPISEEKIPTRKEIKQILQHLPLHIKTYALFLLSGGLRPGEPLTLELDDIVDDPPLTKIHLRACDTKTGRKRWTYLTPEATQTLNQWLENRTKFIQSVCESILSPSRREAYLEKNKNKVFPFSYKTCNKVWTSALKETGLDMRDRHTGRLLIRLHNLRKYFSTRGRWSDRDIPDYLQGHIRGVRAVYNRYDQAEDVVREVYLRAVPSLTILEYVDAGMVEERLSRVCGERIQRESINENYASLLGENRVLRDRLRFVESRLLSLELRQVQLECVSVKDSLHVSNEKLDYVLGVVSEMSALKGFT
jgi:integrase